MTDESLPQHVTVEIMGLMPKLRDDLEISVQVYAGQTCYLFEDPISSRFSRVGLAEYTLLSLLDGKTTIAEAVGHTAAIMGSEALTEHDAAALCKWLIDSQLAETDQSRGAERQAESARRSSKRKAASRMNPIFQKVPLLNPNSFCRLLAPWIGWIFSVPAALAWLVLVMFGSYSIGSRWAQFASQSSGILARDNWIWLLVTWLALKLLHEAGHALACHRFGGYVREAGVLFILLAPLPYVDVTSSWRFDSKWRRMVTAAAGVYVELLVAAVFAVVWSSTDAPLLQQHARNIIVTATVVSVIFNLNPLMRFDGYYLLCDWLDLPNLATHGRQLLAYFGNRYVLGTHVGRPDWPEGRATIVAFYAIAAFAWRLFVCLALIITAEALFWGAGFVLASAAVVLWIVVPTVRLIHKVTTCSDVNRRRVASVAGLATCGLIGIGLLPWYSRVQAPVLVDFETTHDVRTPVGGFVTQVLAKEGDSVEAGQLLLVLESREIELDTERLKIEIDQSLARARKFRHAHEIAALQVELENRCALESRRDDLLQRLRHLEVRAPIAGTVAQSDPNLIRGTFVKSGERILSIGLRGDMRLHALVAQEDAVIFSSMGSQLAQVHLWGTEDRWFPARFRQRSPRATNRLVHPAFGSGAGGPLAVRDRLGDSEYADRWELVEPHVLVEATCANAKTPLWPGQMGIVQISHSRGRLGQVLLHESQRWLQERREKAQRRIAAR